LTEAETDSEDSTMVSLFERMAASLGLDALQFLTALVGIAIFAAFTRAYFSYKRGGSYDHK